MLNRVILIGRLTKDPELRYTPAGVAVAQFTLAIDRTYSNPQGEREADFIPIVVWRQLAETCANYLRKGRMAAVEGRMQVRNYDNSEGRRVYITEVVADNVRFLESSNRTDRDEIPYDSVQGMNGNKPDATKFTAAQRGNKSKSETEPLYPEGKPIDISDDDLPF